MKECEPDHRTLFTKLKCKENRAHRRRRASRKRLREDSNSTLREAFTRAIKDKEE